MLLGAMVPLFSVPHTSHSRIAFSSPEEPSRRFPQSVQNTSDPKAAISVVFVSPVNLAFLTIASEFFRQEVIE